jgi:ABC-type enterobactin transport system permease subunit
MPRAVLPYSLPLLLIILIGFAALSLTLGAYPLSLLDSLHALLGTGWQCKWFKTFDYPARWVPF